MVMSEKERLAQLERLERIEAHVKEYGLEHSLTMLCDDLGELVVDGYGGVAGDAVYFDVRDEQNHVFGHMTKEKVEELYEYLGCWLDARRDTIEASGQSL